jgi:16S rRNA processing protein RimM
VIRPRGIIGEVIVEPLSDHPSRFEEGAELWLDGCPLTIAKARRDKDRWVLLFEGVTSMDEAEKLRGGELVVDASSLPPLEDNNYYFHDLVGCCLEDSGGTRLGVVTGVVPGTPGWLEVDHDGKTALVPMVHAFLMEVDLEDKRIVIDPPAGLFEASGIAIGAAPSEEVAGAGGDGAENTERVEIDAV